MKSDMTDTQDLQVPASLADVRQTLQQAEGSRYWRSLDEVAGTPAFKEFLEREFPVGASEWEDGPSRRNFLKLMGASMALTGLAACARQPDETIVPYVRMPEEVVPGKPLFFATGALVDGYAVGLLAESHTGRPTKLEGNPGHPASLGSTTAQLQATILDLYDPDRAKNIRQTGQIRTWDQFAAAMENAMAPVRASGGAGLRILTPRVTSPTLAYQLDTFLAGFSEARWHAYEPADSASVAEGVRLAFKGSTPDDQWTGLAAHYRFDRADVVLSIDANFLEDGPGAVRYARDYADHRLVETQDGIAMSRHYSVFVTPTVTSAAADERLGLRPSQVDGFVRALAARLGVPGVNAPAEGAVNAEWLEALAADLLAHVGRSVVVAGKEQSAAVHALVHAINYTLNNVGETVVYTDRIERQPLGPAHSLAQLTEDLNAGEVSLLVILGGNPVYDAPADLEFLDALKQAKLRVHLSTHANETSEWCHWLVPETHYLESWSDARAFDGTVSIVQPLIEPLYGAWSAHEVVAALFGQPRAKGYDIVRDYWRAQWGDANFDRTWRLALSEGVVENTALPPRPVRLALANLPAPEAAPADGLEIVFRPDPTVGDGRFANNGWLQELPKPITKITWENAVYMSLATAEELGVENMEDVEVSVGGRSVNAPVWILPGHPKGSITVHLGYGRPQAGRVGSNIGYNAYALRTADTYWHGTGAQVARTAGRRHMLARTEDHNTIDYTLTAMEQAEARHLLRVGTLADYEAHPDFAQHMGHAPAPDFTMYAQTMTGEHQWGMAIDLNRCNGCNACITACQSENNIPIVGKDQVIAGREMHWIRVDRYFTGGLDEPATHHQPVPCMQCENAPCEVVCPVAATVHSEEGLNDMVYNRCIGTRYCSNNCPYKVRRFNFFRYNGQHPNSSPSYEPMRNPNVTVRGRGVMEKCTYCVQRINAARIEAKVEGRKIRDGEVVTACQAACPSQAIVFGDISDPESRVSKLKASTRNYAMLADLNVRPRTTYLAKLTNPNPVLHPVAETEEHHGSSSAH